MLLLALLSWLLVSTHLNETNKPFIGPNVMTFNINTNNTLCLQIFNTVFQLLWVLNKCIALSFIVWCTCTQLVTAIFCQIMFQYVTNLCFMMLLFGLKLILDMFDDSAIMFNLWIGDWILVPGHLRHHDRFTNTCRFSWTVLFTTSSTNILVKQYHWYYHK